MDKTPFNKTAFKTCSPKFKEAHRNDFDSLAILFYWVGGDPPKGPQLNLRRSSTTYYLRPLEGLKRAWPPWESQNELLSLETYQF